MICQYVVQSARRENRLRAACNVRRLHAAAVFVASPICVICSHRRAIVGAERNRPDVPIGCGQRAVEDAPPIPKNPWKRILGRTDAARKAWVCGSVSAAGSG